MPPPDTSKVLNALIAKVGSSAPLLSLMVNGVYEDMGAPGATKFVVVSELIAIDTPVFGGTAFVDGLYLVEARALLTPGVTGSGGEVGAAALIIDELLHDQPLTVEGYELMTMHREEFVRGVEVDAVDRGIRWKRRGGRYRVQVAPA